MRNLSAPIVFVGSVLGCVIGGYLVGQPVHQIVDSIFFEGFGIAGMWLFWRGRK